MKRCSRCGETKTSAEFYREKTGYLSSRCRPCIAEAKKEWERAHPERVAAANKRRRAYKREWERQWLTSERSRAVCPQCGQLAGAGSASPSAIPSMCQFCVGAEHDLKMSMLEELWNAGATFADIRAELGWSNNYIGKTMFDGRSQGYHLPYRYTSGKRGGRKFIAQVAA